MQIDIFQDPACFQNLSSEWLELLSRAATNQIFMTPAFLESWWETIDGGELRVITCRDENGVLRGVAPLFLSEKELCFIGCETVSDYLDFIVDREFVSEVSGALFEAIKSDIAWQSLNFCSIPQTSPTLFLIKEFSGQEKWQFTQTQQDVCPVITLPPTWEEYVHAVGKKQRHEMRRKHDKLIRETHAEFEELTDKEEVKAVVEEFISLHQKSSQTKKDFWDEKHIHFFKTFLPRLAELGWVRLFFLKIGGKRVATMLGFEYNNQFFLYNSGYDAEEYKHFGIGSVLTAYTIQKAIEAGSNRYDFLRGNEEYKYRYGAVAEPIFDVKIKR